MYNRNLKERFIESKNGNVYEMTLCNKAFGLTEEYECLWNADLCTKSNTELQPMIDEISGRILNQKYAFIRVLRDYVRWCIKIGIPNACNGMLFVSCEGVDEVKMNYFSSPEDLQHFLDFVFDYENERTVSNVHRCCLWLIYCGVREQDVLTVNCDDVNLDNMKIDYKKTSRELSFYPEAYESIKNCKLLDSFIYKHSLYNDDTIVYKPRVESELLLRGGKEYSSFRSLWVQISRVISKTNKNDNPSLKVTLTKVWRSGLFYRMYQRELAGVDVDFDYMIDEVIKSSPNHEIDIDNKSDVYFRKLRSDYRIKYERWKLAFYS